MAKAKKELGKGKSKMAPKRVMKKMAKAKKMQKMDMDSQREAMMEAKRKRMRMY